MSKNRTGITSQVRASIKTESYNKSDNTIDVVFVTESPVVMEEDGQRFVEILSCDPSHIRLERLQAGAPFLKVHNPDELENQIGVVIDVWFESNEGWAKIRLSKRPDCAGIVGDIIDGILKNISVGYDVLEYESLGTNDKGYPILKAIDWEPAEISATPIPADYMATTRSKYIKQIIQNSKKRTMKKTREQKIRSLAKRYGVDETVAEQMIADGVTVEDALEKILEISSEAPEGEGEGDEAGEGEGTEGTRSEGDDAGDDAGDGDDEGDGDGERSAEQSGSGQRANPVAQKAKPLTVAQERQRASTIFKAVRTAGLNNSLALELIEKGTTQARAMEIIVNKMAAKQTPTNARVNGRDESVTERNAMEQAILHRSAPGTHKITLEKANEYRSYAILDFAKDILERKGINVRGISKAELTTRALSTSDFPALLGGVTNKILRKAYDTTQQTWKPLATQYTASDFKTLYGVQFGGTLELEKVLEGGEYKQDSMKEGSEPLAVETFGKIVTITRQAIINDDLNGFARTAQMFGNAAANTESKIMWGQILNNPKLSDGKALFHADHKNLAASGAALSETSLTAAAVAMMRQTGLDSKEPLNLYPKFLIVSPEQLQTAKKLLAITDPTKTDDVNTFAGAFQIIWDQRLPAGSWYMAADPSAIDGLVYAYLSGHEGLYTEQREGFEIDGIQIKARLDFGGGVWDYRGLYKNAGA